MFEKAGGIMLPVDNDIRKQVLDCKGNIVISASAGTGKTHTTVARILRDIENNKTFRTFAAITFTKKAAKEIANRLGISRADGFVGTNDNFVWTEIIQPFMYDVYGNEFKKKINPDYGDENQIETFDEGVEKIRQTGFMYKYNDNHKNFAFQLALDILKRSHSASRYIKSKYFRIYIDEYQDSDIDMHIFFMYLCDVLKTPLFIVGDVKQSIYGWRGAYCDGFQSLFVKDGFKLFKLWHNFRSNKAIQNYSNIFMESVREQYTKIDFNEEVILYEYNNQDDACNYIKQWIDENKKCAILSFRNDDAKYWSNLLNEVDVNFVYVPQAPLDDSRLETEHIWIARGIANYIMIKRYSEYDFKDEIPIPDNYKISILKEKLKNISNNIKNEDDFFNASYALYSYLNYDEITDKIKNEVEKLYETVTDEAYISSYNSDSYLLTSGTIHSSKGLEFCQVIINAGNYNFNNDGIKYLHYVAVSRPEERLLILSEHGYFTRRYLGYIDKAISDMNKIGYQVNRADIIRLV
jgi:ATP-dependent exoDNAse (exonuclease V) beta subunit